MATLGFDKIVIGIMDENDYTTEKHTIDATVGGSISASVKGLSAPKNVVYASNSAFYVSSVGFGEVTLDLAIADLPEALLNKLMGTEAGLDGISKITSETAPVYASVMLETKDKEGKGVYIALAKGKFSYPDIDLKTAESGGSELTTDSISGSFIVRKDKVVYLKGRESTPSFTKEAFEEAVFLEEPAI
jgi:phi13 family phage major tail protein